MFGCLGVWMFGFAPNRRRDGHHRVQQDSNRPLPPRRRKRRRENANEIPLTPLNTIPLPPSPAHGSHTANTRQICNELGGFPNYGVLARRPAARQQKGAVSRREPRATGRGEFFTRSRMIGTTHSKARNVCSVSARYHASSFKAIMRGVPREKARSEPVGSAPPAPRRCPLLHSAAFARHTVATLNWQCLSFTISEFHSLLVHFIRAEIRTIRPHDCSMVRNYM